MGLALLRKWGLRLEEHHCKVRPTLIVPFYLPRRSRTDRLAFPGLPSVNGGSPVWIDQPSTGGGHVILSVPVKLTLNSGSNTITFGAGQSSEYLQCYGWHNAGGGPCTENAHVFSDYAADLDKIIVY